MVPTFRTFLRWLATAIFALATAACGGGGNGDDAPRPPGTNASLSGLSLSAGGLDPAFAAGTTAYTAEVPFAVAEITVTATTSDSRASLTVDGAAAPSGSPSDPVLLSVGETIVDVVVTAEDGVTVRTYSITVTRAAAATNADLVSLSLSAGALDQIFDTAQPDYTATLSYLAASVLVLAEPEDPNAEVTVNGVAPDGPVVLDEGANVVDVLVTAEDGITTRAFELTITRGAAADFAQRLYIKPEVIRDGYRFGAAVDLEGSWLAVGAPGDWSLANTIDGDDGDSAGRDVGGVTVYQADGSGVWTRQAYLKADNAGDGDRFGDALAMSGNTLAVGAWGEQSLNGDTDDDTGALVGAVYVFVRDGNDVWTQQAYLKASNADEGDEFGRFLDLDGDTLVVGAWHEQSAGAEADNSLADAGAVYVFVRDESGVWSQTAYIKPDEIDEGDLFGGNVTLSGNTLVVGATGEDGIAGDPADNSASNSGAAYVFERDLAGGWSQTAYLKADNADPDDAFGANPDLEGDVLMVAAIGEQSAVPGLPGDPNDNSGNRVGAAYEFTRAGDGSWSQTAYFKASNAEAGDDFGSAVAYEGDTLVVGARKEAGLTGDVNDNSGLRVGAAYVFFRENGAWRQAAYVKAFNPDDEDEFGNAASFDGNGLVITAEWEDSAETGLGGSGLDNSLIDAGAGYLLR
ncbi:MAG: integrin [Pseudomonadales bacterium]|nr:integrin [Pseudomonadales bacterium]NIX08778.1 integrin [Pseudomonadales bacterium]